MHASSGQLNKFLSTALLAADIAEPSATSLHSTPQDKHQQQELPAVNVAAMSTKDLLLTFCQDCAKKIGLEIKDLTTRCEYNNTTPYIVALLMALLSLP